MLSDMKKLLCFIILAAVLLTCSCEKKPEYEYIIEETPIPYDFIPLKYGFSESDRPYITVGGYLVYRDFTMSASGHVYYCNYILTPESDYGYMPRYGYYRAVLETEDGRIFLTESNGKTACYDGELNYITDCESIYFGYALDDGRYFALNFEHMTNYEYAYGVDSPSQPHELLALCRYSDSGFERLTECIFESITLENGVIVCRYPESDTEIKLEPNDLFYRDEIVEAAYDEESGLYSITDPSGEPICKERFKYASQPVCGRIAVVLDGKLNMVTVTAG